jgi:hypothetical protein
MSRVWAILPPPRKIGGGCGRPSLTCRRICAQIGARRHSTTNGRRGTERFRAMRYPVEIERMELREDYVARARALAPEVEANAALIEQDRRLPPALVAKLVDAGLFHMLLPRSLGGGEVDPGTFARVILEIARADASTAWCLCQASGCSMSAAYLTPAAAQEIFGAPGSILAWGPGAGGARGGGGRRLPGERHVELRQRMPSRHVARRPLPDLRRGRLAPPQRRRRGRGAHHALPGRRGDAPRRLARGRAPWHGERCLPRRGALRPPRAGHAAGRSARAAGAGAALLLSHRQPVFLRLRQRGPRHRAGARSTHWSSWRGTRCRAA